MPALLERDRPLALVAETPAGYGPAPDDQGDDQGKEPAPAGPESPIPEKLLARLWQKRAARQREFRTNAGRRVRVLYPGRPGTAAGPDFRDALLEVEGLGLVQGDVELHRRQQDWYAHGHAADPNYNGVVLHAALETDDRPTNLASGHRAPVISLAGLLDAAALSPPPAADEGEEGDEPAGAGLWALLERRGWPRPADARGLGELLDAAGDARFRGKAAMFAALNREQPPAQTLYEGLLEGLGYRANRQPFLKLAQRAPWPVLAGEALAQPPPERVAVIEGRLLQLSGLAEGDEGATRRPAGYGRSLEAGEWHCFRVRPANHPRRRIAGAARLLARFLELEDGLVASLAGLVSAGNPARLTAALTVKADEDKGVAYVGAARAKDLAVNVVLPFCHGLAGEPDDGPAQALYQKFPKLQDNEITRELAGQLLAPEWGRAVNTARRQQGLIHLHRQLS